MNLHFSNHWKFRTAKLPIIGTLLSLAAFFATSSPAWSAITSKAVLEQLPILDGGRVMPLDSFARHTLLAISGKSSFSNKPAILWAARTMFTPELTDQDEIFLVDNPEVVEALGIAAKSRARYSYEQLKPALPQLQKLSEKAFNMADDARSPVEKELIRLYNNVSLYITLCASMQFAIPQPDLVVTDPALRKDLNLPPSEKGETTFLDLVSHADEFSKLLEKNRDTPQEKWNGYQKQLFAVAGGFNEWSRENHNGPPALFPVPGHAGSLWINAWELLNVGARDEAIHKELGALADLVRAFRAGRQLEFDMAARTLIVSVIKRAPDPKQVSNLKLEVTYNKSDAFYGAEIFYGLAFLVTLLSIAFGKRWLYLGSAALILIGILPHTYGIIARMIIMGRPPVTNLYATFIFVAWVCAVLGLAVEYFQRNRLGLLVSSAAGLALLMTSARFAAEGDTMGVMVAVLDSNFWLATHVVCISIGYAGTCVAGLLGAIYLIQAITRLPADPVLRETQAATYGALGFGLIFSFLGTMLGGVWADQSWGRFWGWDPKENGALIIVLWTAIVFHSKLARLIGPAGFAAGCVLGIIAVLAAWLGVNLLSVGLHSYGFTSGLMRGFTIACFTVLLFVAIITPLAKRAPAPPPAPK